MSIQLLFLNFTELYIISYYLKIKNEITILQLQYKTNTYISAKLFS